MTNATHPAPVKHDVTRVDRGQLLHAVRNSALQALEIHWQLGLRPPTTGRLAALRHFLQVRLLWPLISPLLIHQQEQNSAVVRAFYAMAEQNDYIGTMGNQLMGAINELRSTTQQLREDLARVHQYLHELDSSAHRERHLVAQQIEGFAEQLVALEEAEQQLRSLVRAEIAPLPSSIKSPEVE